MVQSRLTNCPWRYGYTFARHLYDEDAFGPYKISIPHHPTIIDIHEDGIAELGGWGTWTHISTNDKAVAKVICTCSLVD